LIFYIYAVSIISYLETTYVLKEDSDGDFDIPKWMQFLASVADKEGISAKNLNRVSV